MSAGGPDKRASRRASSQNSIVSALTPTSCRASSAIPLRAFVSRSAEATATSLPSQASAKVMPSRAMAPDRSALRATWPRSRASFTRLGVGFSVRSPAGDAMTLPEGLGGAGRGLERDGNETADEPWKRLDRQRDNQQAQDDADGRARDHHVE